jgi:hypothetical protein
MHDLAGSRQRVAPEAFLANHSANLATHSSQTEISVMAGCWVPDRVLGAEERVHLLVGLPANHHFNQTGSGGDSAGFSPRRSGGMRLRRSGVDVRVAAGLIACFFHGYLRSPEATEHRFCCVPATSMVAGPGTDKTSQVAISQTGCPFRPVP